MRKLMMFASFVLAACALNAAQYVWGFGAGDYESADGSRDGTLGVYADGKAFLYLGTVTASATAFDFSAATYVDSATFDSTLFTYGNEMAESPSESALVTSTAAGQAFSLILVEGDVASLAGYSGNYVLYTGSSTQGVVPGATPTYYAEFQQNDSPIAASDWATMSGGAVPEPTSGLLMLLGIAGLALRRRRA